MDLVKARPSSLSPSFLHKSTHNAVMYHTCLFFFLHICRKPWTIYYFVGLKTLRKWCHVVLSLMGLFYFTAPYCYMYCSEWLNSLFFLLLVVSSFCCHPWLCSGQSPAQVLVSRVPRVSRVYAWKWNPWVVDVSIFNLNAYHPGVFPNACNRWRFQQLCLFCGILTSI